MPPTPVKTIHSLAEAIEQFKDMESQMHKALNVLISSVGTPAHAQARRFVQMALHEYTDATRVWGVLEGIEAQEQLYASCNESAPQHEEMH